MDTEDYVDINIDDIADPGEVIPDGMYLVHIDTCEKKHKAGSEYPYLEPRMHPLEGPNLKKRLKVTLSFHPDAAWNMKEFVPAAGVDWPKGKGFYFKDLVGKDIRVTVKVKPHPDDVNRKVNEVGPPYKKA